MSETINRLIAETYEAQDRQPDQVFSGLGMGPPGFNEWVQPTVGDAVDVCMTRLCDFYDHLRGVEFRVRWVPGVATTAPSDRQRRAIMTILGRVVLHVMCETAEPTPKEP